MSARIMNSTDFEKLETLEAPSIFGAIGHAFVVVATVIYRTIVYTVNTTISLYANNPSTLPDFVSAFR